MMQPATGDTKDKHKLVARAFAGMGALIAAACLLTYLAPATRQMMLDWALSFLLQFLVVGLLWWTVHQSTNARKFWGVLAAGWTLNLLGNIAWGVYEVMAEKALPIFTGIDGLYLARYVLLFLAFWRYPARMANRRWVNLVAVVSAATAAIWLGLFQPALASAENPLLYFLGGALYPILDAVLIYVALLAWAQAGNRLQNVIGILALAMVAYGIANWINFSVRVASLEASPNLAAFFWPLSDVLTGLTALYIFWQDTPLTSTGVWKTSRMRVFEGTPYLASLLTVGLTVYDLASGSRRVDPVLTVCAVIALGTVGYDRWRVGQGCGDRKANPLS